MTYLWFKAFHIIFMVTWFAGLFYIFRLFVYHAKHKDDRSMAAVFTMMERKLLFIIMHPSMALTLILGFLLLSMNGAVMSEQWFHWKLAGVAAVVGYQIFAGRVYKRFARGDFFLSEKACRIINEVPGALLILIVILVVVKPHFGG